MNQVASLINLQSLDTQLDQLHTRLKEIESRLSEDDAIRAAESALLAARQALEEWQHKHSEIEQERLQLLTDADAAEEALYSGSIHNPRELNELQAKLEELRERHTKLEGPLLRAIEQLEKCQEDVTSDEEQLVSLRSSLSIESVALNEEKATITNEAQEIESEIGLARSNIEGKHLVAYDALRKRLGAVAVAKLNEDGCSVCGVDLTMTQVKEIKRGGILACPTCGRLLVN